MRRSGFSQLLLVLLLPLLHCAPAAAAGRPWRTLETPRYQVLSQLTDQETTRWSSEFDQFIATMTDLLRIDPGSLPPLRVILFSGDKEFNPYKPARPDGRTANVSGIFARNPTWSVIGLVSDSRGDVLRQTIFHEATHWLMSADEGRQPAWFSEGIAELLSTFEQKGKEVSWAKALTRHLSTLDQVGVTPLREFLATPRAIFNRDDHTENFYAQSWAFTHFLLFSGDPARAALASRFIETFKTNSGEATVDAVFGAQLPGLEKAFKSYVAQAAFSYRAQPARPVPAPLPAQAASPAQIESALGFLAMGAGRDELARRHASKAIELDAATAAGHEILAYLAAQARSQEEVKQHAEAALRNGSKDSEMFLLMGNTFIGAQGGNQSRPDADRQRANLYASSIKLNPRRLASYERLTEAIFGVKDPTEEDGRLLALGMRAYPGEDWIRVGSAVVEYRLGRRAPAREAMGKAMRPGSTLDDKQRAFADQLQRGWVFDTMNDEIRDAVGRRDLIAARAAYDKYRGAIAGDPRGDTVLQQINADLTRRELTEVLTNAMRANKPADVRAAAEKLLVLPDLPPAMRTDLEKLRAQ
jgi:hypothetical protein